MEFDTRLALLFMDNFLSFMSTPLWDLAYNSQPIGSFHALVSLIRGPRITASVGAKYHFYMQLEKYLPYPKAAYILVAAVLY